VTETHTSTDAAGEPPASDVELPEAWRPTATRGRTSLPATTSERAKDLLLGKALPNEALAHERLGKPTALAVFSSDALSSTAYATEEILKTLLEAGIGVVAFSYVLPITLAMVVVLAILMFSYRQTIKAYPSAGGAYIVTKDNLGLLPAQVAGVALLTDYVLTVAVSVSAGVAALYSAVPSTYTWRVPIALAFIALIAWGNLRGVKESGRIFAAPTYGFIVSMMVIILIGLVRQATGHLHPVPPSDPALLLPTGPVGIFLILHAFASGGAAMTGVEAISNGVPAFKPVEWKNARTTLMWMGTLLGIMFIGLSWLAAHLKVVPTADQTVISQIAKAVLGNNVFYYAVQLFTLLILVLAANTSFADFPRLASFHAEDAFMPRQLTKRGHRLSFSNGILFLSVSAAFLVVLFRADVSHLIPLYAIGVFTSFTLSQAGMAKRHIRLKEPGWRSGLLINGGGAIATGVVTIVIAITKFTHGAWAVMLLVPLLVAVLVRLNHQYEAEAAQLGGSVDDEVKAPVPAIHVSLVMIDKLDAAAARALHVARTLRTDRTEAVHLAVDEHRAARLIEAWETLRPDHIDLRLIDSPERKLVRTAMQYVSDLVADGKTQVSVLIPRLLHRRRWHRLLHDSTAEELASSLSKLEHVNVTFVPFHLGTPHAEPAPPPHHQGVARNGNGTPAATDGASIGGLVWRQPAAVTGRVTQLTIETVAGTPSLVATISDGTGELDLLFLGRSHIGGVHLGVRMSASGMAAAHRGRLTIINPLYQLLSNGTAPH
jgi:amino acid transporter